MIPINMITVVNKTLIITETSIFRPAKGFLPTASTPLWATLPKYINPSTNAKSAMSAAVKNLSASKGDKYADCLALLKISNIFLLTEFVKSVLR